MTCARCGTPIAAESNYCSRCGAALVAASTSAVQAVVLKPGSKKVDTLSLAMLGIALVTLIVLGFAAMGDLRGRANSGTQVVYVPRGEAKPANYQPEAQVMMPEQVRSYVAHLKRVEERKSALLARQKQHFDLMLIATGDMPKPTLKAAARDVEDGVQGVPPTSEVSEGLARQWQALLQDFEAVAPPSECKSLSEAYFDGLSGLPLLSREIAARYREALAKPKPLPNEATPPMVERPLGRSRAAIDDNFERADIALADLCARYDVRKEFVIASGLIPDDPTKL